MNETFLDGRVIVTNGDITAQTTDAIVDAANWTLLVGADGAIHGKGGKQIYDECRQIRQTIYPEDLPAGQTLITSGGLPFHFHRRLRLSETRGGPGRLTRDS
jgi:O-acetyl-ADP-ribose deacetylase (regulator of RNase III)